MSKMSRGEMIRRLDDASNLVHDGLATGPLNPRERNALAASLATLLPIVTGFGEGGFLPGFHVTGGTLLVGVSVAVLLTVASGIVPAWQAAKLPVVQALRRVE